MNSSKVLQDFITSANRILLFFTPDHKQKHCHPQFLTMDGLMEEAHQDQVILFAFKLLIEEFKCHNNSTDDSTIVEQVITNRFPTTTNTTNTTNLQSIEQWLRECLAGLCFKAYPTVEVLLKRQGLPSIYSELDSIFPATRLLNKLLSVSLFLDPNCSPQNTIVSLSPAEVHQFHCLSPSLRNRIINCQAFTLSPQIHRLEQEAFADGPSFKHELLLNHLSFTESSEFKGQIPPELLEMGEDGQDASWPFAKRWARRIVAKSSALAKILFNPLSFGEFPTTTTAHCSLNFTLQLPESVGIEVQHLHSFDSSMLSQEFLDFAAFSVHLTQFLTTEIPSQLFPTNTKVRNTDIFSHAPIATTSKSSHSLASFRAFLLAAGIQGHLSMDTLSPVDIHEILNFDSAETSACLLIALALANRNNHPSCNSKFLVKLFSMHLANFQSAQSLDIPPILQLSAAFALGIFKFRSFDRGISLLLIKEIFRTSPMNVNFKPIEDTPLFAIIPGITLGMCLMAASHAPNDQNNRQFAMDIEAQLNSTATTTVHQRISILIATALINFNNPDFKASQLPWARSLPDLLDKEEATVFWCQLAWKLSQWSRIDCIENNIQDQGLDKIKLDFNAIFDSVCRPAIDSIWTDSEELGLFIYACQCLMANSLALALKYAGKQHFPPKTELDVWINKLASFPILHNTDPDYFLSKIQLHLLTTYQFLLLCKCIIFSGSAEESCWARLRQLLSHPLLFKYGNGRLLYSSFGFLFSGKGRFSAQTTTIDQVENVDLFAIFSLFCTLLPIFPVSPVDSELEFLPLLMDSLWPFAMKCK